MSALSLRCRPASRSLAGPDLTAFHGGARLADPEGGDPLVWLLPTPPEPSPMGISLRPRIAPMPAPRAPARPARAPELGSWAIGRDRSRWSRLAPSRALVGLAVALPLALTPMLAYAGKASAKAPVADLPDKETSGLAFGGTELWVAILGSEVEVTLGDGVRIRGALLTQSVDEVAVVLAPDGVVMRVPKELVIGLRVLASPDQADDADEIAELRAIREAVEALRTQRAVGSDAPVEERARPRRDDEPKNGRALTGVGAGMTAAGAGVLTMFGVASAIDSSFAYYGFPLLFIGPSLLGPGIPLLITGLVQQGQHRRWERRNAAPELSLGMGPTHGGWSGSLSLRW